MNINTGSFRDPSGCIFSADGSIYRSIFPPGMPDYEAAGDAGAYEKLIQQGLLIPHEETALSDGIPAGTVCCLQHPRIPMITYPWEWSFSMLKEAALLHLEIMEILVPMGFWLRDANAFNVQFDGEKLCLIDTLSVGRRVPDSPWPAYGQFCSHFLAPLAAAAYADIRLLSLWRGFINGFPLDLVAGILPHLKKYRPGLFMHLTLHSRYQSSADRKEDIGKEQSQSKSMKVSDRGLVGLIRSLKKTVQGIAWKSYSQIWEGYTEIRTYDSKDVEIKSAYVEKTVKELDASVVWDMGANTGEFSALAASQGAFVASIEGDPACTEYIYREISAGQKGKKILPLTMDLANPSPGLGWDSRERLSLKDRGPADLLMALALVHHLVFSCCIPFPLIAKWFSELAGHVLVEFVPPTDPMVKKLLKNRNGEHHPYDEKTFTSAFEKYFDSVDTISLQNGRSLYLYRSR